MISICLTISMSFAQAPDLINFQGKLNIESGPVILTFRIYSSESATTALWTEVHTGVSVNNGVFNVMMGGNTPFSNSLFTGSGNRYLGITVNGENELSPRLQITSVAYAIRATQADEIASGQAVKSINNLSR